MPVGFAPGDADFGTIEGTGGSKTVTLSVSQIPSHRHNLWGGSGTGNFAETVPWGSTSSQTAGQGAAGRDTGGGGAHDNKMPYVVCLLYKRTA